MTREGVPLKVSRAILAVYVCLARSHSFQTGASSTGAPGSSGAHQDVAGYGRSVSGLTYSTGGGGKPAILC